MTPAAPHRSAARSTPSLIPTEQSTAPSRASSRSSVVWSSIQMVKTLSRTESILYGGLVVGALDALDAIVFFGFRGATPTRIFQSIAAGLLGRASFQGGMRAALLGVAIHFFIAFCIVATYYA